MDNFLSELYHERFKSIEEEKRLREKRFPPEKSNEIVRNDQSITETSKRTSLLDKLIVRYLELHGFSSK